MAARTKIVEAAVVENSFILNIEPTSFSDRLDMEWREKVLFCFTLSTWKKDVDVCRHKLLCGTALRQEQIWILVLVPFEILITSN